MYVRIDRPDFGGAGDKTKKSEEEEEEDEEEEEEVNLMHLFARVTRTLEPVARVLRRLGIVVHA